MKKLFNLILILSLTLVLTSCNDDVDPYIVDCDMYPSHVDCLDNPEPITCDTGYELIDDECVLAIEEDYLEFYYLNDTHGALLESDDQIGMAYIANLVNTKKTENPDNVLFVVGGDMLQGSALSNYYDGLSMINVLNAMDLDAFTIGNHEFDWGIDTILAYADGNLENGEANFPFLGANIFYAGTTDIPDGIEPYTIVQKGEHKVGIIGTMGYGLEYSIAESKITGYEFADPMTQIEYYSHYLRTVESCDVVIVVSHDVGEINDDVIALTGDYRVDAVFNGHSHSDYANLINGIPEIQSGHSGEFVGYVKMIFEEGIIDSYIATNYNKYSVALLSTVDSTVQALLDEYILETYDLFNTPIIVSDDEYSKYELTDWLVKVVKEATNADIAFHNSGGTRAGIDDGETINLAVLYQIWPFDNVIKTVELTGAQITALIVSNSLEYYTEVTTFDPDTLYLVATNDYVFDKSTNPFINGVNPINTGIVLRDLVESELLLQAEIYSLFNTANEILTLYTTYEEETTINP